MFLRNGNHLHGKILREDEGTLVIRVGDNAVIVLSQSEIAVITHTVPRKRPTPAGPGPSPDPTPDAPPRIDPGAPGEEEIPSIPTPLTIPAPRPPAAPADPMDGRIRELLHAADGELGVESAAAKLLKLGPPSVSALIRSLRAVPGDGAARVAALVLTRSLPREAGEAVRRGTGPENAAADRVAALRVLSHLGGPMDLDLLVRLLGTGDDDTDAAIASAFRDILRRHSDADAALVLRRHLAQGTPEQKDRIIGFVADAESPRGLRVLVDLLGKDPELQPTLIRAISRMQEARKSAETRALLRRTLAETNQPSIRVECAAAVGRLVDPESVEILVGMLSDPDAVVRDAAHGALCRISGLRLPIQAGPWMDWITGERSWWARCGPLTVSHLSSRSNAEVFESIRELSRRVLFREAAEPGLLQLVSHAQANIRAAACRGLGRLGCIAALPVLEQAQKDPDSEVRSAATAALEELRRPP